MILLLAGILAIFTGYVALYGFVVGALSTDKRWIGFGIALICTVLTVALIVIALHGLEVEVHVR